MRYVLLLIPFVLLFANSYAQPQQRIVAMYVQIVTVDGNGNLVSYLESERIVILNLSALNNLIDRNPDVFQKRLVTAGDQKYDLIKSTTTVVHSSATVVSGTTISIMNGTNTEDLAIAQHDGYPVVAGDKVTTYWTILRLAS